MLESDVESDNLSIEIYDVKENNFTFLNRFTCLDTHEFLFIDKNTVLFTAPYQGEVLLYIQSLDNPLDYKVLMQKDMLSFSNLK